MIFIVLGILLVVGFLSYKTYRADKEHNVFYYYTAVAVLIFVLGGKFVTGTNMTHLILAVSFLVAHMVGVFARTWDQW